MMSQPEAAQELTWCAIVYHRTAIWKLAHGQSCTAVWLCSAVMPGWVELVARPHVCMNSLTAAALFNMNEED